MQVAEGVHSLGSIYLNFYVVEDGSHLTVVDTGVGGYWDQIPKLLASIGRSIGDIDAIVQTHTHTDHIGCSARLQAESGASVFVNELEAPWLRGDKKPAAPRGVTSVIFNPAAYKALGHMVTNGGAKFPRVAEIESYVDGDVLDVPGKPRVVFTPGHSSGHSSLIFEQNGILFTGDALVTRDLRGNTGPRLLEINEDRDLAVLSLDRFDEVDAELILPAHGRPWRGRPAEAAAEARRA